MRKIALLACAAVLHVAAATLPPDAPLVTDGATKVDVLDLDAFLLRVPEKMRVPFRSSYDRVASAVDSVYVTRIAAQKAREAGLDKDPAVQRRLQQVQEAFLADLYIQKLQNELDAVDLGPRARELYDADPRKFKSPEQVYVQAIFVNLEGRTREMAAARAQEIYGKATSGKEEFLQLAAKYSDDPDKVRNGGDLGYYSIEHFPQPVAEAIEKLDKKYQIAPPITAAGGFYIMRFIDRKAAKIASFDSVRSSIIKQERERLSKEKVEEFLREVRSSKTTVVNTRNVEAYVRPIKGPNSKAEAAAKNPGGGNAAAKPVGQPAGNTQGK